MLQCCFCPIQVFIDELAHPKYRGFILSSAYITAAIGIMAISSLGAFVDWRSASALAALPSVITIILLYFLHESPTWFVRRYRMVEAERALQWLWGPGNKEQVSDCIYGRCKELHEILSGSDDHPVNKWESPFLWMGS